MVSTQELVDSTHAKRRAVCTDRERGGERQSTVRWWPAVSRAHSVVGRGVYCQCVQGQRGLRGLCTWLMVAYTVSVYTGMLAWPGDPGCQECPRRRRGVERGGHPPREPGGVVSPSLVRRC